MPNRIIKESIRTSKTVNAMTDFQFRVWVYLITYVDDYGRGSADPELIKGFVFPRRKRISESDIEKALAELAGMGCISLYDVDGESYFCFPNWSAHQRIQTKKSKFPAPVNSESPWVTVGHGDPPPESESKSISKSFPPESPQGEAPPSADVESTGFDHELQEAFEQWISYKRERREGYKPTGLRNLVAQIRNAAGEFGSGAVASLIQQCMASGYKGIMFDRLKGRGRQDKLSPVASANKSYDIGEIEQLASLRLPDKL